MEKDNFTGPLFIIGLPRSGTKLLRDLLNRNPRIGIPTIETHFIPHFISQFGDPPDFRRDEEFQRFYEKFTQTTFYYWYLQKYRVLKKEDFGRGIDRTSWRSIFEFILRFYAPKERDKNFIWGDKTPSYLRCMNLLKSLYPEARFLHIIRDPRDHCLSVRKIWGRNLYRAAHIWRERIEVARANGRRVGKNYREVFYESLIEDPYNNLKAICDFLDCDFVSSMMELEKPSEDRGDAKGQTRIVKANKQKYLAQLSSLEIRRIEEIAYPVIQLTPYKFEYDVQFKPLSSLALKMFELYDGWALARFNIHDKGLYEGLQYFIKLYRESH